MADLLPIIETMEHRWMRAWISRDAKELKSLAARDFNLLMGSKPSALLDRHSWIDAATTRWLCTSYRFGDLYARRVGAVALFATQMEIKATMDDLDWSGRLWVTDLWRRGRVRRGWQLSARVLSRPEDDKQVPAAIRSLQLWR